ncbi:alkaline phosphatase family protein [Halorussus gelatinilyticus]|uniref:Alkaline phosphatase family protein n=1 Tax=Halorussus gelatinilyticus TaxID=2937524 RepID=A0A8U0II71_9EURY|nr:alkaline phosphatase family protein [Halorussus gelatinilyticus]UPW00395.1 alkaline phosphatase family protein [Halorussus gelatinilyticus]
MSSKHNTVVVGFDALDFRYLDEFESSLPEFERLRNEGVEAPLESTFPPWTGSAWPSMYTGTDPSHHGTYGFFHSTAGYPDEDELVTRNRVRQPALWNYLTALDEPAVVLNVPVTHPAEPVAGVLVPGYLAHEEDAGYPEGIRSELSEAIDGEYRIYADAETSDDHDRKRESYLDLIRMRGEAAEYVLAEYDWRVAVVQVQKTDTVFHNFDDRETFRRAYERADEVLGRVREAAGDANVVVCSDHGMGEVDGYTVYLNEILRDAGFVEATADSSGPSLMTEKATLTGAADGASGGDGAAGASADGGPSVTGQVVSAATTALGTVGVTPGDAYSLATRLGVGDLLTDVLPYEAVSAASEGVDWANSKAYTRSVELGVRVNLAGREPSGVVTPEEYEGVRDDLIDLLSTLRTPDGDPVFEWVRRREEVYDGPYTEQACDVLFMPADMNHTLSTNLIGQRFVPTETHDHQRDGVFLADGPAFADDAGFEAPDADPALDADGARPGALSLTDVAPIAMAAAGLDVPARMTGEVPEDLLADSVSRRDYGDVPFGTDRAAGDDGSVERRLEDLGYL